MYIYIYVYIYICIYIDIYIDIYVDPRQKMASRFWKDIAPENRKINHAKRKKRKRKIEDNIVSSNCKNPFHFLRRYRNLSNKRHTRCPCSIAPDSKQMPNQQITSFLTTLPRKIPLISTFIHSRSDKIREQHDRRKIFPT